MATVEQLPFCTATQLSNSLLKIVRLYARAGFIVHIIMMDQEFDKVKDTCMMVKLITTTAREHAGEIKRYIQTITERSHTLMSDPPYTKLPHQVVIHLVYFAVLWLNSLPEAAGVSDKYSPRNIVHSHKHDFKRHCKATFGSYTKLTMIQPLPTLCALARSLGYSLAPLAIARAHTKSSTSTWVSSKKPYNHPPPHARQGHQSC